MAKKLHWLVVNRLFWSDFEQLDWCLWKQLICTKFQQFWGNWPSSFAPYSHIFMMIPNIMGHLPLTEHIKAFSICFQLLGQQFDFSVFCSNSLAYGIVHCESCLNLEPFSLTNQVSNFKTLWYKAKYCVLSFLICFFFKQKSCGSKFQHFIVKKL